MTTEFAIKGEWFLPTKREQRIYGILTYHPQDGAELELHGSFEEYPMSLKPTKIILGFADNGKLITLYDCNLTNTNICDLAEGSMKTLVEYSIRYILIGLHAKTPNELKFNKISSEIFNLGEWIGISGIDLSSTFSSDEKVIKYNQPEPISFEIDDNTKGSINFFVNGLSYARYQKNITLAQQVKFQAETIDERNIDELLNYLFIFENFLIFAFYKSTFPLSITLGNDSLRNNAELFFTLNNFRANEKPLLDVKMVFNYRSIQDQFPSMIKTWYAKYELLKPACDLVFEQFYNGDVFTENTFLNLAQAAETFHARLHDRTRMPKKEYNEMKKEILGVISNKKHLEWLKNQFNFGNYLTLNERLIELTEKYSNPTLDKILGDKSKFIKKVKDSRNYYTHYSDKGAKKALKSVELFYLSERLKVLLVCALMIEVGFDKGMLTLSLNKLKSKYFFFL